MPHQSDTALIQLDRATRLLAEVRTASDAKDVMDIASAAEHYARKHKLGEEAIGHAHAIKTEAQAMLGKFLDERPAPQGRPPEKSPIDGIFSRGPTNADLGLSKNESAAAQLLATIKEEQPEEFERIKIREKTLTQVQRERQRSEILQKMREMPSGKFRILYADPPWSYNDRRGGSLAGKHGAVEDHYAPMSMAALGALPIPELTE